MVTIQIDTGNAKPKNQTKVDDIVTLSDPVLGYLEKKWTYQEWLEEMKQPVDYPDPHNSDDPRYYMKHAMNVPPVGAYYLIPERQGSVGRDEATKEDRRVFYGWNNVTDFEKQGVLAL